MLILLSPSKKLDTETTLPDVQPTQPPFLDDTKELATRLKGLKENDIKKLMNVSDNIAALNHQRFQDFQTPFTENNARPALFTFKGDVYDKMDVADYSKDDLKFAQNHVRILSGLYGMLRPLDLMQPYRLEMGTKFENARGKNLYQFWNGKITDRINKDAGDQPIVNLASNEYFSAVQTDDLKPRLLNIAFKQYKGGNLKTIGLMAKRARGRMTDYVIKNHISDVEKLKDFTEDGYTFQPDMSDGSQWVFTMHMD